MSETLMRDFPTNEVLSVVTGRLMGDIGGVYNVLNYMTGENLFTHQLPRVGRGAVPVILESHPELKQAVEEAEQVTTENWGEWRATWEGRYGATIGVPRMTIGEHERIDPLSEAAEMIHPDKIVVMQTTEPSAEKSAQ